MQKKLKFMPSIFIPVAVFVLSFFVYLENANAAINGVLRVPTGPGTNPRYFTDDSGKAIYLIGSHWGYELQDNAWGSLYTYNFNAYLNLLKNNNHNFIRMWSVEHTMKGGANPDAIATPMPYKRVSGYGLANDNLNKFDLNQFDESYFNRLRERCLLAQDNGMYVGIMLFQGVSIWQKSDYWYGHYFNRNNNKNSVDGDPNHDGFGSEVHTLSIPIITQFQENYVKKVIDTVNDLDNVLYEIVNEEEFGTQEWQYHMIDYIKNYELTKKPKQHPVGMTWSKKFGNDPLYNSGASWISPVMINSDPPLADGSKVIITDTDHGLASSFCKYPEQLCYKEAWRSFTRGHNFIVLDGGLENILDPNTVFKDVRKAMGQTRAYAERIDLKNMSPINNSTCSNTTYCLRNPGQEYLVYQPLSGSFNVNLLAGNYAVEWFNPATGAVTTGSKSVASNGNVLFNPSDADISADAVLYLKKINRADVN